MSSIIEVANRANVSPATVSRVFSGSAEVKEETKSRILAIASELGYTPRRSGRHTQKKEPLRYVGLVIPTVRSTYYSEIIGALDAFLKQVGIKLLACCVDEQPEKELSYLKVLRNLKVSGIILVPSLNIFDETVAFLNELESEGIPVVLLDRDIRQGIFDGVFMDNYSGAYHGTIALLDRGHRNIAFLQGRPETDGAIASTRGFREAMDSKGVPFCEDYILHGNYDFDIAYKAVKECFRTHPEVSAVFSSSQRMALGCIFAFTEMGLRIGEDVSIICNGRPDIGSDFISHVSYPITDVGRESGKLIYNKILYGLESPEAHRRVFFEMKLYLRGSENFRGRM